MSTEADRRRAAKAEARRTRVELDAEYVAEAAEARAVRSRRAVLMTRALHAPEGLTKYAYTKGMTKADAMAFWTDAKALGFVGLGTNDRGTKVFGLRSEVCK